MPGKAKLLCFGVITLTLLGTSPLFAQSSLPDAAVAPLSILGKISDGEKGIIYNGLLTTLSKSYNLVSQTNYAKAEQSAFEQLDLEQCTEEQCIRKIQEILQIDRLFVLQIFREKGFTQIRSSAFIGG